jgi:hypothetical protein
VEIVITFGITEKNFANVFNSFIIILQPKVTQKNNVSTKGSNGNQFSKLLIAVG